VQHWQDNPARGIKKLVIGSNQTWKLRQINLVKSKLEAHDNDKSTSTRQQCKWISSLNCFKWHLDPSISSRIHKWCLDQLTSDILHMVIMIIANVQEIVFIDKSIICVVSHLYTWYQPYKKVVPQVILNFKRSSNEECIPHYKELKFIKWMTHEMT